MANSTDTYWSINDVSIQTLGFNMTTDGGMAPPPLRGGSTLIPYRVGQELVERVPDSRTLPFRMWVIGADENGLPTQYGPRADYEKNFKKLRGLIWNQGRPIKLTKRWKEYGSNVVKEASATAIYETGLPEEMTGPARSELGFDLFLADPFFYGPSVPLNLALGANTLDIQGDYPSTLATIKLNGALQNPRLTNNTEGHYVEFLRSIASGASATLDVDRFTAKTSSGENAIRNVKHFGHKHWLSLRPGTQQVTLASMSGAGAAVVTYIPRWL